MNKLNMYRKGENQPIFIVGGIILVVLIIALWVTGITEWFDAGMERFTDVSDSWIG